MIAVHICEYYNIGIAKRIWLSNQIGHTTELIYNLTCIEDMLPLAAVQRKWNNVNQLKLLITKLSKLKDTEIIFHVHTTVFNPDLITLCNIAGIQNKTIWHIHDYVDRCQEYKDIPELIIVPSKGYQKYFNNTEVVYHKVPESWMISQTKERVNACVLESDITTAVEWRDYREIADNINLPLFIYPAREKIDSNYQFVMQRVKYFDLLQQLQVFKYGYAGSPNFNTSFNDIVTHKFWEYLSCGVVPVLWQAEEMREIINSNKFATECLLDDKLHIKTDKSHKVFYNKEIYLESEVEKFEKLHNELKE